MTYTDVLLGVYGRIIWCLLTYCLATVKLDPAHVKAQAKLKDARTELENKVLVAGSTSTSTIAGSK